MKTPEQWLEEYYDLQADWTKQGMINLIQAIQKDVVACTQADHNKALSQLRSFLHNELHKVNFGH